MKKLRVAVVGAGIYGVNHIRAFDWSKEAELVAVCDLNRQRLDKVTEGLNVKLYTDIEEMLQGEDLDAVSIATPDAFHKDPAIAAIRHGKHIFVEKPLATTSKDALEIIEEARKHKVRVAVDYHKRWDPAAINLRNVLKEDETGLPIRGYMSMDDIIDVPLKWFNWADKSSPVHFLGTHCYDQIRWYMGCEAVSVYAVGSKKVLMSKGVDTYDSVQAFIEFENGCYWTVENSWIYPSGFPKNNDGRTMILTENRVLRLDSQDRGVEYFTDEKGYTPNSYFIINNNGRPYGFGIEPINDFIDCILENKPFIADGIDGLESLRIAEAVHLSLERGEKVIIRD